MEAAVLTLHQDYKSPNLFGLEEFTSTENEVTQSIDDYKKQIRQSIEHATWLSYAKEDLVSQMFIDHIRPKNYLKTLLFDNLICLENLPKIKTLPNYYNINKQKLSALFQTESLKSKENINVTPKVALNTFNYLNHYVSELNFDHAHIEITASNTIKINLLFPNNQLLMISKAFNEDDNIIYSFFINREFIASEVLDLPTFTTNFNTYLSL